MESSYEYKNITRYLGSIFLLLSLTTQNAYAEGFDLFKPNDDNWLIKNIFIPLFYPDTSPFSPISGVFLAGILAFGEFLQVIPCLPAHSTQLTMVKC